MLSFEEHGTGKPSLVFMPFLAGSQREWIETVGLLSKTYHCITVDLPGFGASSSITGYSVSEMADAVIVLLSSLALSRYVLIGHSMAGKVSAVATRLLMTNTLPLKPPCGLVLVASSPPGSEPMSDSKRDEMLESLGNQSQLRLARYSECDRPSAEEYIKNNIASPLPEMVLRRTVDDVMEMNPAAWAAWLKSGSKEDWSSFVGVIDLPTLIVAGIRDQALGPEAQRAHTLPHFSRAHLAAVGCSHLIPLEKPDELTALISTFLAQVDTGVGL